MPRHILSTHPRATHGIHAYRNARFLYKNEWVSGLHIIIDLRRFGLKTPAILAYLQRLECQAQRKALLGMPCLTQWVH